MLEIYYVYFRWKGENVSTTEVSNVLADLDFIHDANVYGVTVPGNQSTVLPAKSDSDVIFCLQNYHVIRGLESIDHLCINPINRIGLIHK